MNFVQTPCVAKIKGAEIETTLTDNTFFLKLEIALNLRTDEIMDIFSMVDSA
jgi:uncharacterized protein YehS (DUF1456 family)